jgi:flagellar M-ring protein FliF
VPLFLTATDDDLMSIFRNSTDQAREAIAAMPMQSRVISVLLVAAIVIGLGFLVRGSDVSGKILLFGGRSLDEQELDAIEMAFSASGLNDWQREGRRIKVPRDSRSDYMAALDQSRSLPISLRQPVQAAIDKASVFEPNELRQSREMHAKEQHLSNKIMSFGDISWASVEYDQGERIGFSRSRAQSASVIVIPEGTDALPNHRVRQIQDLIRSSFAGMMGEEVVVVDTNATSSSASTDADDPLLRRQREVEARVVQKVRSLLVGYPARVEASAEIDPMMDVEKAVLTYDPEPTSVSTKSRKIESSSNRPANRGVPGAGPNGLSSNRAMSLEDNVEVSTSKEDERESTGVAGQQYESSRMASLQVKRVRVSVGLPRSYYLTVHGQEWLQDNPDKTADDVPALDDTTLESLRLETKENIQSAVTVLLPEVSAGEDRFPLVEVWDYRDFPEPLPLEPDTAELALTWLAQSWQTILLVMLALAALLVARSAARSGSRDDSPLDFREGFGLEIPSPPPEMEATDSDPDRMTITGGSLKEELTALVENNPEVAANVIRSWVGEAA